MVLEQKLETTRAMESVLKIPGRWAGRFIWASIVQGLFSVIWTAFIVSPWTTPAASRVIAAGSAGTWLFVGYSLYLMVGVVAVAVTALFYFFIEGIQGKTFTGAAGGLAWAHLLLMNIGVAGATWIMMYGGYAGGAALLPTQAGGGGLDAGQVHVQILGSLPNYIAAFVLLAMVGALLGGLGYLVVSRRK